MSGPPPKNDSQRRRSNKPASYGQADAEIAGEAAPPPRELGLSPVNAMISDLWDAIQRSVEAKYYSEADWHRVRLELSFGNDLLLSNRTPGAQAWATFQSGLNAILVSPADKRRAGIELKPKGNDEDDDAADEAMAEVLSLVPKTGTDGEA